VASQTFSGSTVLAPRKNAFADVFTDSAIALNGSFKVTANGHLFVPGPEAAGVASLMLYNFDLTTGTFTYVGRINFAMPDTAATVHTWRFTRAIDSGTTGWKIFVATTGTVLINGGLFMLNNIALADFVQAGFPTIGFATGNNQKAVYDLQDPAALGVNHVMTAVAGGGLDGTDVYIHNGIAATHQYYKFDASVSPTYTTTAVTIPIASPGVVNHAGHAFVANDPVVFTSATTLPTGFVVGTVYFVRNQVAGTSYELSATSGGASINATVAAAVGAFAGRAFGTTSSNFSLKTGNLTALSGTLLLTDSERLVTPGAGPLAGSKVIALGTTTNLYQGLISELTSGATSWPSLTTVNVSAAASVTTAITPQQLTYMETIDRYVYTTNTSNLVVKQHVNSVITNDFSGIDNHYMEGLAAPYEIGMVTTVGMDNLNGWLFLAGSTVGQRGIVAYDLRSHDDFDYSYVVTKVLTLTQSTILSITPLLKRLNSGSSPEFGCYYRTSGFGSITGGWTSVNLRERISLGVSTQIQFKISYRTARNFTTNPGQLMELLLEVLDNSETSTNWVGNNDNTTSTSPSKSAFRLKNAYATSVPQMFYRAYDDSGVLVASANTTTNPTSFEYSTNNGSSWIPLGTVPNTVGTLLRYNWVSPPGVQVTVSLQES
jgi:hypothetical protein